jgi:hypothetical protein
VYPNILNLSIEWRFTLLLLYPQGKSLRNPLDRMLVWAPGPVWSLWRKEKSLASAKNRTYIPRLASS